MTPLPGWSRETLAGKTIDVFDPQPGQRPRFGTLFLHPLGQETLCDNHAFTKALERRGLVCVSPHGGTSWWADRPAPSFDAEITPVRFLVNDVLVLFKERWQLEPPRIGLFGISMGGQGALRLAFQRPDLFPVVAGISSAIEYDQLYGQGGDIDAMYDSREQCRQDTALLWVPPFKPPPHIYFCIDPTDHLWYRGNDRLHEKMTALGVEHVCDLATRSGGHSWEYFDSRAEPVLDFIVERLEQESLRLI